jgi:aminopeptidase N
MRKTVFATCLLMAINGLSAQLLPWAKGNTYRSADNPLYWKNKKPYEGYWQQDVYYQIKADLNDVDETITGTLRLVYYNNSPHSLSEAYFHLYQNAVQPGSLVDELYNKNKTPHTFGPYEKDKKGTEVFSVLVNGAAVDFNIDYTVLKTALDKPLAPGDSCVFDIRFKTYFDRGSIRRRMKVYDHHGYKHFNGVHWYPRICVYDRKFTWETAQHMEHEFYGDFGAYEVELNLPNQYINEATGTLQNPETVYPGDLRQKLDISNFANKPIGSQPSVIVAPDGTSKSWRYHANNVHDFAWTADPTYRIGEANWNGVQCIALAQENNAAGWQQTAKFTADVIALYSKDFGMYEYPKMVAADAADGMEYPMLTLDGGVYPSHQGLIAHEVGHNWFFGMLGNNETYRASLDEGFTQFLTSWSMKQLSSRKGLGVDYGTVYAGYMFDALDGEDAVLNTHSDDFENAIGHGGGYRHVYYKTATMLYNLQYVLGDEVFLQAMKDYVKQWKICHPYVEDFRNSIIMSAKTDLNGFFDQWFETRKVADYALKVKKKKDVYSITINRKGDMVMPVDVTVIGQDANKNAYTLSYTIPVSQYQKPGTVNLKPWIGWGKLRPSYRFEIKAPGKVKDIYIDPSQRMADINRMNNQWPRRYSWEFDKENGQDNSFLGGYKMQWRPDVWYNTEDGIKPGLLWNGQYAMRRHVAELGAWYGTGLGIYLPGDGNSPEDKLSYLFNYSHELRGKGTITLHSRYLAGVEMHKAGWFKDDHRGSWYVDWKYMQRHRFRYLYPYGDVNLRAAFLPGTGFWSRGVNNTLTLGRRQTYRTFNGNGSVDISLRNSIPWSDAQYGVAKVVWLNEMRGNKLDLRTRVFAAIAKGNSLPAESALYTWGASPEELQDNKFTRDFGSIPLSDMNMNLSSIGSALSMGGGLNLRGMQGYLLPTKNGDTILAMFRGNRGASVNAELDFSKLFSFLPKFSMLSANIYVFGDAGVIGMPFRGKPVYSGLLADAGVGTLWTIKNWQKLSPRKKPWFRAAAPLQIRADFPVFVNAVSNGDDYLKFRWVLGINKLF